MTAKRKHRKIPQTSAPESYADETARLIAHGEMLKAQKPWDPTAVERQPQPAWLKHYRKTDNK